MALTLENDEYLKQFENEITLLGHKLLKYRHEMTHLGHDLSEY